MEEAGGEGPSPRMEVASEEDAPPVRVRPMLMPLHSFNVQPDGAVPRVSRRPAQTGCTFVMSPTPANVFADKTPGTVRGPLLSDSSVT